MGFPPVAEQGYMRLNGLDSLVVGKGYMDAAHILGEI